MDAAVEAPIEAKPPELAPVVRQVRQIRPQKGPQEEFLSCEADVAIIGGGAYGGKSYALMLDDVQHVADGDYASVTFRRDTTQIRNPGGLWDEACALFAAFGARPVANTLTQLFPSGAVIKFWHLEHDSDVYAWDGAQVPVIKFDQLESFTEMQFWYMLSRNRDPSGHIKPYVRATCNPMPDNWLGRLLAWWIDQDTGYAIPERSGVLRWFLRINDEVHWADSREELVARFGVKGLAPDDPKQPRPLSLTFIVARIYDNKIGLERDPLYLAKLQNLPRHERERLLGDEKLGGNWKVKASAGMLFRREWCTTIPAAPDDVEWIRGWDLGATRPSSTNPDPDWTVGVKLGKYIGRNRFVIAADIKRLRENPNRVEDALLKTAQADGRGVRIRGPQDPGQAGKSQARQLVGLLTGFTAKFDPVTGDKVTRFSPFSAQAEAGNVDLVEGIPETFLEQLEAFPDGVHDDDADAVSEAFNGFSAETHLGFAEYARRQAAKVREQEAAAQSQGNAHAKPAAPPRAEGPAFQSKSVADVGAPAAFSRNQIQLAAGAKPNGAKTRPLTVAEREAAAAASGIPPWATKS